MASTDAQFLKLDFLPGFHRESTQYSEEGKWFDGNRVRFREGKPENLRGYEKFSQDSINGIPREILTWVDNNTRKYIAIGTNKQAYVVQNETQYDVTPIINTVSSSDNFSVPNSSTNVRVSITAHGVSVSDRVILSSIGSFGGTSINGTKTVTSVEDANHFFVSANVTSSSSATGGGSNGVINILLPNESSDYIQGLGYGAGEFNAGVSVSGGRTWNSPAEESDIIFQGTQWTFDTFGEDLLALRRGTKIFVIDISTSTVPTRLVETSSPSATTFIVSPNDRHVICYGTKAFNAAVSAPIDPLLIRWSDQEDYDEWKPTQTNTAGDTLLTEGTRIVGVVRSRNTINIWTDRAMYIQQFVGPPFIFQFTQVGSNCGLIGQHAAIDVDGVSYWMGDNNFYVYDGRVQTMPCTIRRHLFDDFNMTNKDKVYAGINSEFKEIIWLYPLSASTEPNAYVIYNYEEKTWVYGKLFENGIVTTFADRVVYDSTITTGRTSATGDVLVWSNEPDGIYEGDGKALTSFIESATFDLDLGKRIMYSDRIIPDYQFTSGEQVRFSIKARQYPTDTMVEKGPFTITQNTRKIDYRVRGRQAVVRVSADSNGSWRWGSVRMNVQPDGDR